MKILKNIYVFTIVSCSVLTFWAVSTKQTEQSDFLLRNVEALAVEENYTSPYSCVRGGIFCNLFLNGKEVFSSTEFRAVY